MRYVCIFHLKNVGALQDDFWCLFLNIWMIFAMLVINSSNWILPGIYPASYETCSCISQDYSQSRKFESTSTVLSIITLLVSSFVAARINIYKFKLKMTVLPLGPSQILKNKFPHKLLADLTLTIGSLLLLIVTFAIVYIISSRVEFNTKFFLYLLTIPVALNLFSFLFYAKNANARKTILRELYDFVFHCNQ